MKTSLLSGDRSPVRSVTAWLVLIGLSSNLNDISAIVLPAPFAYSTAGEQVFGRHAKDAPGIPLQSPRVAVWLNCANFLDDDAHLPGAQSAFSDAPPIFRRLAVGATHGPWIQIFRNPNRVVIARLRC